MGYDIKEVKVWGEEWNSPPELVSAEPTEREKALFNLVKQLFDDMNRCATGEVYIRAWPYLGRTFEGGYSLSARLAADGWLDPGYIAPKKELVLYGLTEERVDQKMKNGVRVMSKNEELTDLQALRCVMAAVMYSEIRHERYLSHNLEEVKPEVLYAATFEAVDGLIKEGVK